MGIIEGIIKSSNQQRNAKGKGKIKILSQFQKKLLNQSNKSRENSLEDSKIKFYWNTSLANEKRHIRNNSELRTNEKLPMNPSETVSSSPKKKIFMRLDKTNKLEALNRNNNLLEGNKTSFSFYKVSTPSKNPPFRL